jgi:transposase
MHRDQNAALNILKKGEDIAFGEVLPLDEPQN